MPSTVNGQASLNFTIMPNPYNDRTITNDDKNIMKKHERTASVESMYLENKRSSEEVALHTKNITNRSKMTLNDDLSNVSNQVKVDKTIKQMQRKRYQTDAPITQESLHTHES